MSTTKAERLLLSELSRRYVRRFDPRKLSTLSRQVLIAIAFEDGLKSRAGTFWKPRTLTTRVRVKPKNP